MLCVYYIQVHSVHYIFPGFLFFIFIRTKHNDISALHFPLVNSVHPILSTYNADTKLAEHKICIKSIR